MFGRTCLGTILVRNDTSLFAADAGIKSFFVDQDHPHFLFAMYSFTSSDWLVLQFFLCFSSLATFFIVDSS